MFFVQGTSFIKSSFGIGYDYVFGKIGRIIRLKKAVGNEVCLQNNCILKQNPFAPSIL